MWNSNIKLEREQGFPGGDAHSLCTTNPASMVLGEQRDGRNRPIYAAVGARGSRGQGWGSHWVLSP